MSWGVRFGDSYQVKLWKRPSLPAAAWENRISGLSSLISEKISPVERKQWQ